MSSATARTKLNLPFIKIITKIVLYTALLFIALVLYSFLFTRIVRSNDVYVPPAFAPGASSFPPPKRVSFFGGLKSFGRKVAEGTKSLLWRRKQISVVPTMGLPVYTTQQRDRLNSILESLTSDPTLCDDARLTNWNVNEELVLRYLDSADWSDNYHGKS